MRKGFALCNGCSVSCQQGSSSFFLFFDVPKPAWNSRLSHSLSGSRRALCFDIKEKQRETDGKKKRREAKKLVFVPSLLFWMFEVCFFSSPYFFSLPLFVLLPSTLPLVNSKPLACSPLMVSVLEPPLSAAQAVAPTTATGRSRAAALDATAPAFPRSGGGAARTMQTDNLDLDVGAAAAKASSSPASSGSDDDDLPPYPTTLPPPPFYDPRPDDEDEEYLNKREISKDGGGDIAPAAAPHSSLPLPSDASLTCPGCFSTLTRCSQRHAEDPGIWRSLFVDDYAVVIEATGRGVGGKRTPPLRACSSKRGHDGAVAVAAAAAAAAEARCPSAEPELPRVACAVCEEVVGCVEEDGVFVFFNVLPSA